MKKDEQEKEQDALLDLTAKDAEVEKKEQEFKEEATDKEQEIKQRAWSFLKLHSDIWDFFVTGPPLNFLKCLSLPPLMIGKIKLL